MVYLQHCEKDWVCRGQLKHKLYNQEKDTDKKEAHHADPHFLNPVCARSVRACSHSKWCTMHK